MLLFIYYSTAILDLLISLGDGLRSVSSPFSDSDSGFVMVMVIVRCIVFYLLALNLEL
jgi:hypothetical protein